MKQNLNQFEIKKNIMRDLTPFETDQVVGGLTTVCNPPLTDITITVATTESTPQCGTNIIQYL
jgi:hypothetical protein